MYSRATKSTQTQRFEALLTKARQSAMATDAPAEATMDEPMALEAHDETHDALEISTEAPSADASVAAAEASAQ